MKSTLLLTAVAALALGTTACETKKRDAKTDAAPLVEAGVKNESVRCFNTSVETMKTEDGAFSYKNDTVTVVTKVVTTAADGSIKVETKGEVSSTQYTKNDDGSYEEGTPAYEYTYSATRETKETKLKNGDIKAVSTVKSVSVHENDEGQKVEKAKEEQIEEVTRTTNGVSKVISTVVNGVAKPVYDEETTETVSGNVKTTHTVLKTPYTEKIDDNTEVTVHSSETACTVTTTK